MVVLQLLPRDRRRVRPYPQNLRIAFVEALGITAGIERDLKPVTMGPIVLKRVACTAQCGQHPHHQLPHVLPRETDLLLLQLQDEVRQNRFFFQRQHRRFPRSRGSRGFREDGKGVEMRRGGRHPQLRTQRLLRQVLLHRVLGSQELVVQARQTRRVHHLLPLHRLLVEDHVPQKHVLVLLQKQVQILVQRRLVLRDARSLRVPEYLLQQLQHARLRHSTGKSPRNRY